MTTLVISIITAAISAVLGGVVTYWTARRDLQLKFDASLRDLRIDAYKKLWKLLEHLAKYGRPDALSKSEAQQLRSNLLTWYFHTGGIVLSTSARQDYFALLDGLELVIAGDGNILSTSDDEYLRVLGSRLRTAMTRDVGTRRTFIFRGDTEWQPRLERRTFVEDGGKAKLVVTPRRRLRLARRQRRPSQALVLQEPHIDRPGATLLNWDAARQAFVVRVESEGADDEIRLFLLEDGRVIEGPKGWRRGSTQCRRASVIWLEDDGVPPREA